MAKRPKPTKNPPTPSRPASSPSVASGTRDPAREISDHLDALKAGASPAALAAAAASPPAAATDLSTAAAELAQARMLLDARNSALEKQENELLHAQEKLTGEQSAHVRASAELAARQKQLDLAGVEMKAESQRLGMLEKQLRSTAADLARQQLDLAGREANAMDGFTVQLRDALTSHERNVEALRSELAGLQRRATDERTERERQRHLDNEALEGELSNRRDSHEKHLQSHREGGERELHERRTTYLREQEETRGEHERRLAAERDQHEQALRSERAILESSRHALENAQSELLRAQKELARGREDLADERCHFEERVAHRAATTVERLTHERDVALAQRNEARTRRDALETILHAREEAERRFGHRTPEQLLGELEHLQSERDRLTHALILRPEPEAAGRLEHLEREREAWQREHAELRTKLATAEIRLKRAEIAVWDIETLRDQKVSLESSRNLLREINDQLRRDVDERIERNDGREVFPACLKMDKDGKLQSQEDLHTGPVILDKFVDDLRDRIAESGLFYSDRTLRCFVAGLAASRLHLLQGISGTGKTSLPLAFAKAIGAGHTVIPVQAGWRDRQDLIGHYNAFDTVFNESECLQALYRARCPQFSDRPYIILLDEMNLSHPEQYFADFLSMLEQKQADLRVLDLIPVAPRRATHPEGFTDGRRLSLPGNVWFVGTANHDETTKDFADKTFDRAHIMELPRAHEPVTPRKLYERRPIALEALEQAFTDAREPFADEARRTYAALGSTLAGPLAEHFEIGWGARLERQWERFFPVVRAAGGTCGEAFDHMLASKVLRRLRNRHDLQLDPLQRLHDDVDKLLIKYDPEWHQQRKSSHALAAIRRELGRLQGTGAMA